MARVLEPKCKQCRREGKKLFLKGERCFSQKCAIVKRNYMPGVHGPGARIKLSDYGIRLREKQKTKRLYRLMERQFRNYFSEALKHKGATGENLLKILEQRLDNTVYRAGFATSRDHARQLVTHGHFLVNGKKVNIPSYMIAAGDIINIKNVERDQSYVTDLMKRLDNYDVPGWLSVEQKEKSFKVLGEPVIDDLMKELNINLVVEFYSR